MPFTKFRGNLENELDRAEYFLNTYIVVLSEVASNIQQQFVVHLNHMVERRLFTFTLTAPFQAGFNKSPLKREV